MKKQQLEGVIAQYFTGSVSEADIEFDQRALEAGGEEAWQYHMRKNPSLPSYELMIAAAKRDLEEKKGKRDRGLVQYSNFMEGHAGAVDYVLKLMNGGRPVAVPEEAKVFDVFDLLVNMLPLDELGAGPDMLYFPRLVAFSARKHALETGQDPQVYINNLTVRDVVVAVTH